MRLLRREQGLGQAQMIKRDILDLLRAEPPRANGFVRSQDRGGGTPNPVLLARPMTAPIDQEVLSQIARSGN
jgi:hypothetical protein